MAFESAGSRTTSPSITTTQTAPKQQSGFRPDIQALRALAVSLVVVYHLWPDGAVPGGYAGVDVFFVISGYLITSHLFRSMTGSARFSVTLFWAKRIRRLLPASLLVLAIVVVATLLIAPPTVWGPTFREVVASGFYFENWQLAVDSVDYLAANNIASPVQHYWSLSVEEQFYIIWPFILLFSLGIVARLKRNTRRSAVVVVAVVTVVSFGLSVVVTHVLPSVAYFATFTRAWEFGLGGLLALISTRRLGPRAGGAVSWLGLVCIAITAVTFTADTEFPGYLALLPAVGTALVIAGGTSTARWSPSWLMARRPVQFLGDISYSLYLWHWPLVVLLPLAFSRFLGIEVPLLTALTIVILSLGLAFATKVVVEDPIRSSSFLRATKLRTFGFALVATVAVAAVASTGLLALNLTTQTMTATMKQFVASEPGCIGAPSLPSLASTTGCTQTLPVLLTPVLAMDDLPEIYDSRCQSAPREAVVKTCEYGEKSSQFKLALVGDSHSASWFPALAQIATQRGWSLTTFFKSSCAWSSGTRGSDALTVSSCAEWNKEIEPILSSATFDIVVTSYFATDSLFRFGDGPATTVSSADGFADAWSPVEAVGTKVVALHDTPQISPTSFSCLFDSSAAPADCASPLAAETPARAVIENAVTKVPGSTEINMNEYFTVGNMIPTETGGVVVWRDQHHFSATYSQSLAPYLDAKLAPIVEKVT
ncbi:acyltransferase family protein [Subtercola sp. YIM 133946]|uniref:acyltransferase family protein n=1 Tax=Subtercola sp. YIM 133946 TaxID=3118909 RepID=UPI002F94CC4A